MSTYEHHMILCMSLVCEGSEFIHVWECAFNLLRQLLLWADSLVKKDDVIDFEPPWPMFSTQHFPTDNSIEQGEFRTDGNTQ